MVQFNYSGLSKSSGIYVIFNNHNWRIYVGSSKCFQVRWFQHHKSLLKNKHSNKFLQADFNKCKEELGHDDFLEFHILEHLPGSTKEQRLEVEEKWIAVHFDKGEQCYNLCDRAISREGSKSKNPEETKKQKSDAAKSFWDSQTEEYKREYRAIRNKTLKSSSHKKIVAANAKKYWAMDGTKAEQSKKAKERWLNPGYRENCLKNLQRKSIKIEQWTFDGFLVKEWPSIKEAESNLKITRISKVLCGEKQSAGGFLWKPAPNKQEDNT